MQFTVPDYYREFSCIAGECPDTCCAGWQIMIDEKSLRKYRKVKGRFDVRLKKGINWKAGAFRQQGKRCSFLNEENLCDIYREIGRDKLCDTCRKYPRHVEEFEGLREISLSLSCPEAARILLGRKEKVRFLHGEKPGSEETYEAFDYLLFSALMGGRDYLIRVLQDRKVPMHLRLAKVLVYAHDFQLCHDRGELYRLEEIQSRHEAAGFEEKFQKKIRYWTEHTDSGFELIQTMWKKIVPKMEVLREEWNDFLKENLEPLYGKGEIGYRRMQDQFRAQYDAWEMESEQLMVYWIFTYFCGAVYDGEIFAKVKMAVVSTLFIRELNVGRMVKQRGEFGFSDEILCCYWYSRELEHSDLNLNRMEAIVSSDTAFGLSELLMVTKRF